MKFGLRETIFMLLLLAMPVAAYFFVFQPRNEQIAEAREEVRLKQAKLRQLELATRSMSDLGQEIDRLAQAIDVFEKKLPVQREVEVLLKQVWELAHRHHLVPKSVRTDKPVPAAQYSELPIRMTILGNFDGFYEFMVDLERLPRITRLPRMSLKRVDSAQGTQLEANITLSIFFDSSDAPAGKDSL